MREELFEELLESIKQGGAILRGEMKPSRVIEYSEAEVRSIKKSAPSSDSLKRTHKPKAISKTIAGKTIL